MNEESPAFRRGSVNDPDADLDRIRAEAVQLRAGLRYGTPPAQKPAVTEDERREQSPTGHLWPRFVEPSR